MIVSLAGLFLVDSTTIRSMAMGAIMVVAVSILAAVTLLPALMRAAGHGAPTRAGAHRHGRPAWSSARCAGGAAGRGLHPGAANAGLLAALDRPRHAPAGGGRHRSAPAVLLVLAIPALSLEFGDGALRQFPEGNETRVGAELAAAQAGPGAGRADPGGRLRAARPTRANGGLATTRRAASATPRSPR